MKNESDHTWRSARDRKVAVMLDPHMPAWLLDEHVDTEAGLVQFDIVHRWPLTGEWERRRFTYEIEVDVLHFRGSSPVSAAELARLKDEARFRAHEHEPL
ncbi:MAG: hypothetical protein Q9O62_15415, partial [Ardenticatenia bacterium]|nr:hypothetical protein [Ardenticatenia bacterium]